MNKNGIKTKDKLRLRAEQKLRAHKSKVVSPSSELQRLVHELEVHQIELEMQNEELLEARTLLQEYLRQYTDLYDFAPVGYFTLARSGKILQANLAGARLLGMERSLLANRSFGVFISTEYRSDFADFLELIFMRREKEAFETTISKKQGEYIFVHIEGLVSDSMQQCRIVAIDITERKYMERTLQESEQKHRALFENMTQGVMYMDIEGRITSVNPAAESILGLSIEKMIGMTWTDIEWRLTHEDGSAFLPETLPADIVARTAMAIENVVMGVMLPKSEKCVWLRINAVPRFIAEEKELSEIILTFEDITDVKRLATYNMLTPREKQVFCLLAKGRSRQVIADILNISPKTVDKHKENLLEKLHLFKMEEIFKFSKLIGILEQ